MKHPECTQPEGALAVKPLGVVGRALCQKGPAFSWLEVSWGLATFVHTMVGLSRIDISHVLFFFESAPQKLLSNSFIIFCKSPPPFFKRCCQVALLKIHGGSPPPDSITQFKSTTARGVECYYVNMVPETSMRLFVKSKLYLLRGWEGEHSCC